MAHVGQGKGHASPYATGGGGTVLEHAYGAAVLASLLQQRPVRGLGDDVAPVEVRFQQSASFSVDDVMILGRCPVGDRAMFVGVRRNPTIGASSSSFVTLIGDYLQMLVRHLDKFERDAWRLCLAVSGPHTAANETKTLTEIARDQPNNRSFRRTVDAPRATTGKVRARLRNLDDVVAAAMSLASVSCPAGVVRDELTWQLLRALRIVELRLEGDDAADRTDVVAHLTTMVGDAARADDLWRNLTELSAGYAQTAAVVDRHVLARDLGSRLPNPPLGQVSALLQPPSGQAFQTAITDLPPACRPRLWAAWDAAPNDTWRLVTAHTSREARPPAVVQDWARSNPSWLFTAAWQVQVAAGELASANGCPLLTADLFVAAAAQGAARRGFWLARAALIYHETDHPTQRDDTLADCIDEPAEPYARAVHALLAGDIDRARRELAQWAPDNDVDHVVRTAMQVGLACTRDGQIDLTRAGVDHALHILTGALQHRWSAGLATIRARLLMLRVRRGDSPNLDTDLRETRAIAIRARDERRRYRGESEEATALACQAAVRAGDMTGAVSLGVQSDDGATAEEAAWPSVCEFVAVAALNLRNLDLARDRIRHVTNAAARSRLDALLAETEGTDARLLWRRAIELAEDDDDLARALTGLAEAGGEELPRFDEFAVRHPDYAVEIRARLELATGKAGAAIALLRTRRRASVTAALHLAHAYRAAGQVDDEVRTLRDAAADFRNPSLRYVAAEALVRADRPDDAARELDSLLATAGPEWADRADALRLAAQLAYNERGYDQACDLLRAALDIEPDSGMTRWALIRTLVHRGDLNEAWRVMASAPQSLEPVDVAEAQLWVKMHRRYAIAEQTVEGCVRLLRRFGDSEQFSATVATTLMMLGESPGKLPEQTLAGARQAVDRFFTYWPTSQYLRRVSTHDVQHLIAQLNAMTQLDEEQALKRRRLIRTVLIGLAPLGLLAAGVGRSYAEIAICRTAGVIPARDSDPAEIRACTHAIAAALDRDVVIDTAAITVLLALPEDVRQTVMACFARVITTDNTLCDAVVGHDSLAVLGTSTWTYDEENHVGRVHDIAQEQAERAARDSVALLHLVESLARYPAPTGETLPPDINVPALITWASVVALGGDRKLTVWSDDPVLRAYARHRGLSATSTPAVLAHLVEQGAISSERHQELVRILVEARIGDMPFDERLLLEVAEDDNWAAGCVAAVFGRPAMWGDVPRAASLYGKIIGLVETRNREHIPAWLHHAVLGAVAAHSAVPLVAADLAARLLVITIHTTKAQGQAVADLLVTARAALAQIDDPDRRSSLDPLPICVVLLREAYTNAIGSELATRYVMAAFTALSEQDRNTVIRALLQPAPAQPS